MPLQCSQPVIAPTSGSTLGHIPSGPHLSQYSWDMEIECPQLTLLASQSGLHSTQLPVLANMGPEKKTKAAWGTQRGKHRPPRDDVFGTSRPCPVPTGNPAPNSNTHSPDSSSAHLMSGVLGHMFPCGRLQCSEVAGSLPETIAQADVTSLLNVIIKGDYFMNDSKLARPEHVSRLPPASIFCGEVPFSRRVPIPVHRKSITKKQWS